MTIETKELVISEELKRKVEMICKFAYVEYSFTNGYIINLKNTNIAYVKPHILKVKGNYVNGKRTKHQTYYENVIEPIVSKEKWESCQYQKLRNTRTLRKNSNLFIY